MAFVTVKSDCGNAPRKMFLSAFNTAFANSDIEFIAGHLNEEVVWRRVGEKTVMGKAAMIAELTAMKSATIDEMILQSIITHGRDASANGEIYLASGERFAFCDVYEFAKTTGTQLKSITSYVIQLHR